MNEPMRLLIDSNVWIDSYLPQRSHHTESFIKTVRLRIDKLFAAFNYVNLARSPYKF